MCGNNMSAPMPAVVPAARKATAAAWMGRSLCRYQKSPHQIHLSTCPCDASHIKYEYGYAFLV
uniref:Predicted gene, 37988 n=1 Tax=Mus musculus TaxID=10090 RepID=J3QM41_MOUSE